MSAKSSKALRIAAIVILSITAAAFLVFCFVGRVVEFSGITSGHTSTSSNNEDNG